MRKPGWLLVLAIAGCAGAPVRSTPSVPVRTGDVHDFDFLAGAWNVHNRTLKAKPPSGGPDEWVEFSSTACESLHIGGVVMTEEMQFPTKGYSAMAIRTFDVTKRQWSIYWIESRGGVLLPPVAGGFSGDQGEFFGSDEMYGRPALFRFLWTRLGDDRARWEQGFTFDGHTWTTTWVMEFARADGAECPGTTGLTVRDRPR